MQVIAEKTAAYLTADFVDQDGNAYAPNTVEWRLDDVTNSAEVVDWTSVTPAASVSITIGATDNELVDQDNISELRCIKVRVDLGLASQGLESLYYRVKNLQGVP